MRPTLWRVIALISFFSLSVLGGDEQWAKEFYLPNFTAYDSAGLYGVNVLKLDSLGNLITGGGFAVFGGTGGTAGIAKWNGNDWQSIGGGINVGGAIYAMAIAGSDLYVGGSFKSVGGQLITNIARWDGSEWHPLGDGISGGSVRALEIMGGDLYAGGGFTNAGGKSVRYIARWNGISWDDLNGGLDTTVRLSDGAPPVRALKALNGILYVGGSFSSSDTVGLKRIARWNGTAWENAGSLEQPVSALESFAGEMIAGTESTAKQANSNLIWKWNGTAWEQLGEGLSRYSDGTIRALYNDGTFLYAGGFFRSIGERPAIGLARWNGTAWEVLDSSSEGTKAIAGQANDLYLSCPLPTVMAGGANGILRLKDGERTPFGAGLFSEFSQIRAILARTDDVIVGGGFDVQNIGRWDGVRWKLLPSASGAAGTVNALASLNDGIVAVGEMTQIGGTAVSGAALYNGAGWTPLGSLPGEGFCLGQRGGELFAGHANGISKWNGQLWTNVGDGLNGPVRAIATFGGEVIAGGGFSASGNEAIPHLAKWDGAKWSPLGEGMNGEVFALAVRGNFLYVGGQFNLAGDVPVTCLAIWDGIHWSAPSGDFIAPPFQGVYALTTTPDGALYVGGDLRTSFNPPVHFIGKWSGGQWSELGSGTDWTVRALALNGKELYMAGDFVHAGGRSSARFARWHIDDPLVYPSASAPNYVQAGVPIHYQIGIANADGTVHKGCIVRMRVPDGTKVLSTSSGGTINGAEIRWSIGDLTAYGLASMSADLEPQGNSRWVVLDDYGISDVSGAVFQGAASYTYVALPTGESPRITKQPDSIKIGGGENTAFVVEVTGAAPVGLQWFHNEMPVHDGTNNALALTNIKAADQGLYYVVVTNAFGSAKSDEVSLTMTRKRTQSITFDPILTQPGLSSVTLSAHASSGLKVVFQVSFGSATLIGNILTLTSEGQIEVQSSQPGDLDYEPAASVSQTLNVFRLDQTIEFQPISGWDWVPSPGPNRVQAIASASSGLPISFDVNGPAIVVNGGIEITSPGEIIVTATQPGDTVFRPATATRSFTVGKAKQTIIFDLPQNTIIGLGPIALIASASSGLPVSFTILSGNGGVVGTNLLALGSGEIVLEITQGGSPFFEEAQTNATVTVLGPPSVAVLRDNGGIKLSWPSEYKDFELEEAQSIGGPWTRVVPTPALTYETGIDGTRRFFRLNLQP